ncbi:MAG: peptidoglycan editing factor PgeF [Deltaproteobacteria bacterium]|nr:peptidoglycan editing factor PgeF [Deltaproteobacteria bacterium]
MFKIDGLNFLYSPVLESSYIVHAFLTRAGGVSKPPFDSLNFDGRGGDAAENIEANRMIAAKAFNSPINEVTTVNQVHGNTVLVLREKGGQRQDADAVVTNIEGAPIGVLTADCLPILLFDPVKKAIGAVHAGWKGTVLGVTIKAVEAMAGNFGSDPKDIRAALGPFIGPCCYPVKEDVAEEFRKGWKALNIPGSVQSVILQEDGDYWLNIGRANMQQLLKAGVQDSNIATERHCTSCSSSLFFSYRKSGGNTGRQLSFIMLKCTRKETCGHDHGHDHDHGHGH